MLVLVLLSLTQTLTRSQRLDYDSWAEPSDGLCRYGNSVECCWGWRQADGGRCQPHCQHACKHGDCVVPDGCRCHPGFGGKACNHDLNDYKCYCLDGYELQPDGSCRVRTCYHANCQYGCEVTRGQVRCTCPSPGLRLGPDRRSCVDIDECASGGGGGVCPRRRKCVNTFGSFFCKCHLGFRLTYVNGRYTCLDKDPRPFCSLNPSSPKCRCKDGCRVVPKVTVDPPRPRTTPLLATTATTAAPVTVAPPTAAATTVATTVTTVTTAMETTSLLPTVDMTTTMLPTTSLKTTTISNKINKEVTQRQRGDVHIPRQPGNNQEWEFDIELGNTAEDARDDPEAGGLHCTFDRGVCSWMSDRDGDLPWETELSPAGQHYLSVPELKAGQRSVRGARLALQVPPSWSHGDLCFSFSHWLTGHHVGVLQVFIKKKGRGERYGPALWSRTGGHGWRRTQVTLTTRSVDRVLMKAERRNGRRGQMAVDDVTLRQGACR
ncbi:hypothetical protein OJAV_G00185450 [Oryzias javanicus]|uniref:EGF-like domain-containing protein n=1 Tax=Oryzias javanicus TaxID=123683 RepID=A0A3S2LTJ7_ORYJA|nr:hypothetical protein OJAV_G00185450 [Oryzias javanicus]